MGEAHPYLKELRRQFRRSATTSEAYLWQHLRRKRLGGFKFRRQHSIGRFVVDFCCVQARLIVEIDGDVHSEKLQARYDANRGEILRGLGYKILRFGNEQVMSGVEPVLARILVELENSD